MLEENSDSTKLSHFFTVPIYYRFTFKMVKKKNAKQKRVKGNFKTKCGRSPSKKGKSSKVKKLKKLSKSKKRVSVKKTKIIDKKSKKE